MPLLIIRRMDIADVPQPSLNVFINKEKVALLANKKEKEFSLPPGQHILRFRLLDGIRSRPFVVDIKPDGNRVLQVTVDTPFKGLRWLNGLSLLLWMALLLTRNWWLLGLEAIVLLLLLYTIMRQRHKAIQITELPA